MQLIWFSQAIADLVSIRAYIARDNPVAATEVAELILKNVTQLMDHPEIGRLGRIEGTKELIISGTPYLVPYRVKNGVIQLLRVLHSSQQWPEKF